MAFEIIINLLTYLLAISPISPWLQATECKIWPLRRSIFQREQHIVNAKQYMIAQISQQMSSFFYKLTNDVTY